MKTKWQFTLAGLATGLYVLLFSSCAPVFSELQSARTAGKHQMELTAGYSSVDVFGKTETGNREAEPVQEHLGLQVAYGITEDLDMRMRFEHLWLADEGGNTNVLGFGPKYEFIDNWLSLYVPVGFAFGGDMEDPIKDTWEIHPTLLFTIPAHENLEVNTSTKYIHAFHEYGWKYMAFNLGLGLSSDRSKYVIRPEIGWAWNVEEGDSDPLRQFSIGVTVYPGAFEKENLQRRK